MDIYIDERTTLNIKEALRLEWLDTNGRGGYASSTILHCHTRRYHGLFVSNLKEPAGRFVLLSKFEDSVFSGDKEVFLSFHKYPDVYFPHGYKYLTEFRAGLYPSFTYQIGSIRILKSIMAVHGEDLVLIKYDVLQGDIPFTLRVKPFIAFRNFHQLTRENLDLHVRTYKARNGFKIQPYDGMPPLFVQAGSRCSFFPSPVWYRNFEYIVEAERGFDYREDLFQPGVFEIPLKEGTSVIFSASLREYKGSLKNKWAGEKTRREKDDARITSALSSVKDPGDREMMGNLIKAGRHFVIRSLSGGPGIIAGYHWFYMWGRDALIALPGLTFCSGLTDEGTAILRSMGRLEKDGLLPNFIADNEKNNAYNSVDSSLWYFWAVQQMLKYTGDLKSVEEYMWPVMKRIIKKFMAGTVNRIFMDGSGLLHAGDRRTQLTWMDACVNGRPVTPRYGYPVEINALWYNAVCFVNELAEKFGDDKFTFGDVVNRIKKSFNDIFWIEEGEYLGDVYHDGVLDHAVRPNQIFAVSLPFPPLEQDRWRSVVERVGKELLTPYGLRTLSPGNRFYRGRYAGDPASRDSAYHQGTVWPWFIGHYGEAYLKVAEDKEAARAFLLGNLGKSLSEHLKKAGLGFISEIFDGDPPHHPNGCIAQAWSVAEVIRLYMILNNVEPVPSRP
ncbi:MAG: amylo-alpha-1,6-glucosidase [Syntrophales bacterium]